MSRKNLFVFTLALDAMPWLAVIFAELSKLHEIPWKWVIVEGAAMNVRDTKWMSPQAPRLSCDGTTAFLDTLAHHPRIHVIRRPRWEGKVEMCNAALEHFTEPGILLQNDGDEVWAAEQYRVLVEMFEDDPLVMHARFKCRYFVGPNVVTTDETDWLRAWSFIPGDRFSTHEPPVMADNRGEGVDREYTKRLGLVFDHYSWCLPGQVGMKERLYGPKYISAVEGWQRLQRHTDFPAAARQFFPWMGANVMLDQVFK